MASTDGIDIVFTGQGGHGSRPQATIDPIVAASATVLRLQTIVSREVEPGTLAVVTVGRFHAGSKSNIIPATATLGLNVRTVDPAARERILASIGRIARAEAAASGMTVEPTLTTVDQGDATVNDPAATDRIRARFVAEFGEAAVIDPGVLAGSEDVGELATAAGAPLVYWFFGGTDPAAYQRAVDAGTVERDIPSNHSPLFAPMAQPTIDNGVANLTVAALEWLTPLG
jgi:amidohydrolase